MRVIVRPISPCVVTWRSGREVIPARLTTSYGNRACIVSKNGTAKTTGSAPSPGPWSTADTMRHRGDPHRTLRSGSTTTPREGHLRGTPDLTATNANAVAFVRDHGQDLRFCHAWGKWLVWTGSHWQIDTSGAVMRAAKATVKRLATQAETLEDEAHVKALLQHVKASLSMTRLKAMVESARSEPGIPVQPAELDQDPWLLNCANGTLDLQTGQLRPHAREDLLTQCLTVPYDPEARCPIWDAFLTRIMMRSPDLRTFCSVWWAMC
jgi:D5-like protein